MFEVRERLWLTPHDIPTYKQRKENYTTIGVLVNA